MTAIEFAFVSPVLLLFMFGILEFAMVFLANNALENAVDNAARTGKTGYVQSGESREQTLLTGITQTVSTLLDPTKITLTSEVYSSTDQIGKPEPFTDTNKNGVYDAGEPYTDTNHNGQWDADQGAQGLGDGGDVVVYNITYPWHVMTPFVANIIGDNGIITLSSRVVVLNEPYTDANQ